MKYLCLCYYDQKKFDALSEREMEAVGPACRPHDAALRASGRLILVGSLALPAASRALRPGNGGPSVSDGPFAPTDEPLGAAERRATIDARGPSLERATDAG